jgi:hypothetical protein
MPVGPSPQWTERVYRRRSGRDHLGLASVAHDRLLPYLSPDIVVTTVHPRYWSFYTFVLDEFWARELPRTQASYREFHRPREAIFIAAALNCDRPEHTKYGPYLGVVGSEKVGAVAAEDPATYDPAIDYLSAPLGGYGAIYAGVIYAAGLVQQKGPGLPFDAPTPQGRVVAAGFREAVADTRYYRDYFDDATAPVPRDVVAEYGRAACLCQLQKRTAPDRTLLRDVFLHAGESEAAERRRGALRIILELADQSPDHPLSADCFRQLIHYRACLHEDEDEAATWSPRPDLEVAARTWRAFQIHEYYAFALNRLWWHLADWGLEETAGGTRSLSFHVLWEFLDEALDFAKLGDEFGFADPGFDRTTPLDEVVAWVHASADVGGGLTEPWSRAGSFDEHRLYWWGAYPGTEPETVPGMLAMLLIGFARVGWPSTEADYPDVWHLLGLGGVQRLAMTRFLTRLRRDHMARTPIGDVLRWIYHDYIINQHQRVAVGKLPDDTYRFRREGDRIWFQQHDNRLVMPDPRFRSLAGAVHDLGFVSNVHHGPHRLTADGRKLLEQGDLPGRPVTGAIT